MSEPMLYRRQDCTVCNTAFEIVHNGLTMACPICLHSIMAQKQDEQAAEITRLRAELADAEAENKTAKDLLRETVQDISRMPVDGPHGVRGMHMRISGFLQAARTERSKR